MTDQKDHNDQDWGHQFDHDVIRTHSETYNTGNSPLDQNRTRTNFQLTALMSEYISESWEHSEFQEQGYEAYKVMTDFMMYLAYQDSNS